MRRIVDDVLRGLASRPNVDLFWRTRLSNGLRYVNHLESDRRSSVREVKPEEPIEQRVALGNDLAITLYGRIDRLELREAGATIIDHKTGSIPTRQALLDGRALQLIAYGMLLGMQGTQVHAYEYWQMPRLGEEGKILDEAMSLITQTLEEKLRTALAQMLDAATPFLARPVSSNADERYGNDYDGISRYDEWAG